MRGRRTPAALLVSAGIFISRIAGLVREGVFAHYFGSSTAAGAFRAAFRIPNFLQNLFGEGVLSASFIPVYARLLAEKDEQEAGRVAGAVFAILALLVSVLTLLGVAATPLLIDLIAPGFHGETRELTIGLVRIFFPGAALLVMSAWCLAVLNSHRRFFLPYSVSVVWNAAIIAGLVYWGPRKPQDDLAIYVAWASVAGSALQFLIQLPVIAGLIPALSIAFRTANRNVRMVMTSFGPVFISRGVVQLSAYVDSILASLLGAVAVANLSYAQTIYLLPVSLFGMAISASELPEMSSATGTADEVSAHLRSRLSSGLRRIAFLVIPSTVAFVALGDAIAGGIYQSGRFTHENAVQVWAILAGSGVGLLASTQGRLYSSAFYALRDTRTPLRFAIVRVTLTTVLGYICAKPLGWGVPGLTISAGVSGWIEFLLLRRALSSRIGAASVDLKRTAVLWGSAVLAAGIAWFVKTHLPAAVHPRLAAVAVLGVYGGVYLGVNFRSLRRVPVAAA